MISKEESKEERVLTPFIMSPIDPIVTLKLFDDIASPITDQKECLKRKNDNLKLQRDLLLPKLISGGIQVSDKEDK